MSTTFDSASWRAELETDREETRDYGDELQAAQGQDAQDDAEDGQLDVDGLPAA